MSDHAASRVAKLDEQHFLDDPDFLQTLHALARQERRSVAEADCYARKCLQELAVNPRDRYLNYAARLARFIYTRSYAPELDVNTDALERLKELANRHPMIFLWSHKSHLDSFVFMRALYDSRFTPQPLSFAGINMNFAAFGALAKRSGAIFLRRNFKHDPIYKLVLQRYIEYLVARRVPLSWAIEGTRSRTGMLMPPKLGLIQWVIDAYRRVSCDDVLLVPVAISFDQIAEIDDYVAMQRGQPKRQESLKWFVDFIAGMRVPHGKIYVRFAEPVALADSVEVSEAIIHGTSGQMQVQKLALAVCNRIEHIKPITTTDLLSLLLLSANGRDLDTRQMQQHLLPIVEIIKKRDLPTADRSLSADQATIESALGSLTATGLLQRVEETGTPVFQISPGRWLAAAYYRNTIAHYFLNSAVAEVALASVVDTPFEAVFWQGVMNIRDLLKFDFFFQKKETCRAEITAFIDSRYPDWRQLAGKSFATRTPLFGHGILRSFFETYRVVATTLLGHEGESIPANGRDALIQACLSQGEAMLMHQQLSTETALSLPLIANAIRLGDYRQLLTGNAEALRAGRARFAAEAARMVDAIDQLQRYYDRAGETA